MLNDAVDPQKGHAYILDCIIWEIIYTPAEQAEYSVKSDGGH